MASDTSPDSNLGHDKILELIKEIGEHERHFNNLCGTYKTMPSTWLLAVFGGIGFVLANKIEPWLLYTAMIGFLGSIGIMLLWIMDLRVYQQLLNAAFAEGLKLENEHKWLPRIRNNMIDTIETGVVSVNISWFYVLGVCGTLLIFNFSMSAYLLIHVSFLTSVLSIVVSGVMVFYLAYRIGVVSDQ